MNFAVWAPDATGVDVCLFDPAGTVEVQRFALPTCSEGVWHGLLVGASAGLVYGLRAHGPWAPHQGHRFNPAKLLLDPWAQDVVGSYGRQGPASAEGNNDGGDNDGDGDGNEVGERALAAELDLHLGHRRAAPELPDPRDNAHLAPKARVPAAQPTRALRPPRPHIARARMVIYEAHVRSLTLRHPHIPAHLRGSYAALAHPVMLAHYRQLGITTLNLLPVHFRADEAALQLRGLSNHWGYSPLAWMAPETRYWSAHSGNPNSPDSASSTVAAEFRDMVDALHGAGLELVLDVVFNHTAELDRHGPSLSLRGLANARYYHLQAHDKACYQDWTGCGNSVNLAEPRVLELVIGALRHWAEHYGVDGFRFDLATTLARDPQGHFSPAAGFFAALQADPLLARLKWIAEPWDIGPGGYQLGAFPAGWMEWNDQYRDTVRAWWLRASGDRGRLAHRLAGSSAQFQHKGRAPSASVNFISAHDGFNLRDLVSYTHKHNEANGEHNRDGHHDNASWNCGIEGETDDAAVLALRHRLQRALLATLLCSQGTPMLLAGDELGHSQRGNNNAYCQDNDITWLDWAGTDHALLACCSRLLALRARSPALRSGQWLSPAHDSAGVASAQWLRADGTELAGADWHDSTERALAVRLHTGQAQDAVALILLNADTGDRLFMLSPAHWQCVFDSDAADGSPCPGRSASLPHALTLAGRSLCVLVDSVCGHALLTNAAERARP